MPTAIIHTSIWTTKTIQWEQIPKKKKLTVDEQWTHANSILPLSAPITLWPFFLDRTSEQYIERSMVSGVQG